MPWNPDTYNQFKSIRYRPFFDLMDLISGENLSKGVDIGCGTGEQTFLLSQKFENIQFLGIDSSAEMLQESKKYEKEKLTYSLTTIHEFAESKSTWDLIFSNAALQWQEDHEVLFPKLILKLNPGGQLAIQMPYQKENVLNILLLQLIKEKPFVDVLQGFVRESPVLPMDNYAQIMFKNGMVDLNLSLRVYPIIAHSEDDLYNFISGSALIPYLERLNAADQLYFTTAFKERIRLHFKSFPAIYPFKRMLLYGMKN